MKIEELMVGDLVIYLNGETPVYVIVRKINGNDGIVCLRQSDGHVFNTMIDFLLPIPLTHEILEKNGFEKCQSLTFWDEYQMCLNEDAEKERWIFIQYHHKSDYIKMMYIAPSGHDDSMTLVLNHCYTHQLQHAFNLCRIDKQITLP